MWVIDKVSHMEYQTPYVFPVAEMHLTISLERQTLCVEKAQLPLLLDKYKNPKPDINTRLI